MIPGANLLKMALSVVARQTIIYHQAISRVNNGVNQWVVTYAAPLSIVGSFQPVPRARYEAYGLDFARDYCTFYSLNNLVDVERDVSSDQISFNGQLFQVQSNNEWFALDGWKGVLCVRVPSSG